MRKTLLSSLILLSLWISSCSTGTPQPAPPEVVPVFSSSFTQTWLVELYDCAGTSTVIQLVDLPADAQIVLQVGETGFLSPYAYQIDEEEMLIVTNRVSPVQNLTLEEAQNLFAGFGDPSVQVWVYASEAEGQRLFDQFVMQGRSVTSSAKVAVSTQQMSDVLNAESNAVGILPRHSKVGDVRDVYSAAKVPVLALTPVEPAGAVSQLIACLQK